MLTEARRRELTLRPRPRREHYPPAFNQQDMWFQYQLLPANPYYNCFFAVTVIGALDPAALRRALQVVFDRHDSLRAAFPLIGGRPRMRIAPPAAIDCPLEDLSAASAAQQERLMRAREREMSWQPFALDAAPLARLRILRLARDRHRLILVLHHLTQDQSSQPVMLRELLQLTEAAQRGEKLSPPPLRVQFQDFAQWQDAQLRAGVLTPHRSYWREQLRPHLPAVELPADRDRPPTPSFAGTIASKTLAPGRLRALRELRESRRVSVFRLLLAVLATLVHRLSQHTDLLLGVPISTRPEGLEELNGYFSMAVPIRLDLRGDPCFAALLAQVGARVRQAVAHRHYPLIEIFRSIAHDPGRPLLPICVSQTRPLEMDGESLRLHDGAYDTPGVLFDLWVLLHQGEDKLRLRFKYNLDLFDATTIERLVGCFETLLASVTENPEARLSELEILPPAQRHLVLGELSGHGGPQPPGGLMHPLFEERVALVPEAVAAVCGRRQLSYGELNARANRVAHWLRRRGAGRETPVAVLGERGLGLLELMVGIAKAGAFYVPLELKHPDARLRVILGDCGARWLLTQAHLAARAVGLARGLGSAVEVACWDRAPAGSELPDRRAWDREPATNPQSLSAPHQLANVFYTSGSTGKPKGAMVMHRGMALHLAAKVELLGLDADSVVAQNASAGFDISIWQCLAVLLVGGRTVIYDDAAVEDVESFLAAVEHDQVTVLETVPSLLEVMLAELSAEVRLPRLRYLISNAETLPVPLARRWLERFPQALVINTYGATECSDDVTHQVFSAPPAAAAPRVGVGRPIAGMAVWVLDRRLRPLPVGCPGEIAFTGAGVGRGYLGDAAKTARTFVPDPWAAKPGDRLYLTGDLGRWSTAGNLEFLARLDDQVKVRGHRLELGEVEAALLRHPAVRQAAALVRPDRRGQNRLLAYVVMEGTATAHLREHLREQLPLSMVPDSVTELAAMPLTPNGKVDRRALPEPATTAAREQYVAPRNALESQIAAVWQEILHHDRVGVHDNYFELGGDSIKSIRIAARLRHGACQLEPREIFQHQTVAAVAAALAQRETSAAGVARPAPPAGEAAPVAAEELPEVLAELRSGDDRLSADQVREIYPLSPVQQGMLFHTLLEPAASPYQEQAVHTLSGRLDPECFARACQALVDRHPILRTVFYQGRRRPLQIVLAALRLPLSCYDLRRLAPADRPHAWEHLRQEIFRRPLSVTAGPLLRLSLVLISGDEIRFVWTFNHVILDGWSSRLLLADLLAVHDRLARGRPPAPADFPPYRDYILWLGRQDREAARSFWRHQLAGLTAPTPLAVDRPPPTGSRRRFAQGFRLLDRRTLQALQAWTRVHRLTASAAFQAVWALLLGADRGEPEVVFGLTVLGRPAELPGSQRMVGPFINTLPLRVAMAPELTAVELMRALQRQYLEISRYAYLSLAEVQQVSEIRLPQQLFDNILDIHTLPESGRLESGGLRLVDPECEEGSGGTNYELAVDVVIGERAWVRMIYAREAFEQARVERLLDSFERLLAKLAERPHARLSELGFTARRSKLPAPPPAAGAEPPGYLAPRSELEAQLAAIWQEVLGVERVGVHDNFFELGGHSLNAMQIVSGIRRRLQRKIRLQQLFSNLTVAELAAELRQSAAGEKAPAGPIPRLAERPSYPLSTTQLWQWFAYLMPDELLVEMPNKILHLRGSLDLRAWHAALRSLMERHPILRTAFAEVDGEPAQRILPATDPSCWCVDLCACEPAERQQRLAELILREIREPFDLARPPLLRCRLIRLAPDQHLGLLNLPHIVTDGVTDELILNELSELYGAFRAGRPAALGEPPIRYVDFVAWEKQQLTTPEIEAQRQFWLRRFADRADSMELAFDPPAAPAEVGGVATSSHALDAELVERARQLANSCQATLFMILMAAFKGLLARRSGGTNAVVGTVVSGRSHPDLQSVAGVFGNPLPVRTDAGGNPSFIELLHRVRQSAIEAFKNQDCPFHAWLEEARRRRRHSDWLPCRFWLFLDAPAAVPEFAGLSVTEVSDEEVIGDLQLIRDLPGMPGADALTLAGNETAEGMELRMFSSAALFERPALERLLHQLHTLLEEVTVDPQLRLSEINLVPKAQRQLLSELAAGARGPRPDPILRRLLEAWHETPSTPVIALGEDGAVLAGDPDEIADPYHLARFLARRRATALAAPEPTLRRLNRVLEQAVDGGWLALRRIVCVDRTPDTGRLDRLARLCPPAAYLPLAPERGVRGGLWAELADPRGAGAGFVGHPLPGQPLHILDRWRQPVPAGAAAEIYLGTGGEDQIATGFHGRWRLDATVEIVACPTGPAPGTPPPRSRLLPGNVYAAPGSELEHRLAAAWRQTLGLDEVGVEDDFGALGGNFEHAVEISERLAAGDLPVFAGDVVAQATVANLAPVVERRLAIREDGGARQAAALTPLTPIQRVLLRAFGDDPRSMTQCFLFETRRVVEPELLGPALRLLGERHPALRIRLVQEGRLWMQALSAGAEVPLAVADLAALPPARRRSAWERAVAEQRRRIDAVRGPQLGAVLGQWSDGAPQTLALVASRLVVDEASAAVLASDLAIAYRAAESSTAPAFAFPPCSFHVWTPLAERLAAYAEPLAEEDDGDASAAEATDDVACTLPLRGAAVNELCRLPCQDAEAVLVTALGETLLRDQATSDGLVIAVEPDRRTTTPDLPELATAVGQFAAVRPLAVAIAKGAGLAAVRRQLAAPAPAERPPAASFRLVATAGRLPNELFRFAGGRQAALARVVAGPSPALRVLAITADEELILTIAHPPQLAEERIEALANAYATAIAEILEDAAGASAASMSTFNPLNVDLEELDEMFSED